MNEPSDSIVSLGPTREIGGAERGVSPVGLSHLPDVYHYRPAAEAVAAFEKA